MLSESARSARARLSPSIIHVLRPAVRVAGLTGKRDDQCRGGVHLHTEGQFHRNRLVHLPRIGWRVVDYGEGHARRHTVGRDQA